MELNKLHFSTILLFFFFKTASQMPILEGIMDIPKNNTPKDLLADTLFKAAIILNNPNKPFGDIGKVVGEIATKRLLEIGKELKTTLEAKNSKNEKLSEFSDESSDFSESTSRTSRQAPPPFPQIETAIRLIGLAINLGTTLLPGAILNVTTTANEQFAPAG
ncbi:uncharacterized protein LOC134827324 [Culicoides brevitarsis]|uniref:uncharacterized protein LOC134827324 n=1 Tax=Culicoides brevitarsis TaxID=469753 RepID=UPI00307CA16D